MNELYLCLKLFMQTIRQQDFFNKTALIRVDFNVPLDSQLNVTDNTRILSAKPTILHVLKNGGSCVLMSHLGRPESNENKFSLYNIVPEVEKVLGIKVEFISDCIGEEASNKVKNIKPGEVFLLENLRFYKHEVNGDKDFAKKLSSYGNIYINDAFGTAHRRHSSTAVIASFFKKKCTGLLLQKEIESIDAVLKSGKNPITAILGGAKVSSKITIINNILDKLDNIILGGGMAYTFIKAQGGSVGNSICENDKLDLALEILEKAKKNNVNVFLPVDVIAASEFSNEAETVECDIFQISNQWEGLDIGPKSRALFSKLIEGSKTILWNGPMGVFEMQTFSNGTKAIGNAVKAATKKGAFSLVGGGDSVAAVKDFGLYNDVSYVSTGGGAMLESLEGKTLPGISALQQ